MRKDLMDILRCPVDKATLELDATDEAEDGEVIEGTLTCTQCDEVYTIEDGIPNLLPPDLKEEIDRELEGIQGS